MAKGPAPTRVKIDLPWAKRIRLIFISDEHIGNAESDEKLLSDSVQSLTMDEHSYAIFLGDAIDAINVQDKRFNPRSLAHWLTVGDLVDLAEAEVTHYAELVRTASGRTLARLKGNHEDALARYYERDVYRELCNACEVPEERRLGYCGFVRLRIADTSGKVFTRRKGSRRAWNVDLFLHHGHVGGRLMGAKALALERLPMSFRADIYAMGHSHTKLAAMKRVIAYEGTRQIALVNSGAFLRVYQSGAETYAEARLLYPQELGPVEVWLFPEDRRMRLVM